jgi:hypothetical protein
MPGSGSLQQKRQSQHCWKSQNHYQRHMVSSHPNSMLEFDFHLYRNCLHHHRMSYYHLRKKFASRMRLSMLVFDLNQDRHLVRSRLVFVKMSPKQEFVHRPWLP